MNEERKNEIARAVSSMEFFPVPVEDNLELVTYEKIPLNRLNSIGVGFDSLQRIIQNAANNPQGGSGIYKITVPPGKKMAQFKNQSGYLGSLLTEQGAVGGGQAIINPLTLDPATMFMAAALAGIDKKLDEIGETQKEMLEFMVQKEKSELKGDLNFLQGIMNNYKFNWNNEKYKASNHIKVLDIKQEAERKIDFYKELIVSSLQKRKFINTDVEVKKLLEKMYDLFHDYQLSLYLFSHASFLEVMLLENFDAEYLGGIVAKIEGYSFNYRNLYTKCYDRIERSSKSSVETFLLKGVAKTNVAAGKTIEKIPLKKKFGIDEKLIKTGTKVREFSDKRIESKMGKMIERRDSHAHVFADCIRNVGILYNRPLELAFDSEMLYLVEGYDE